MLERPSYSEEIVGPLDIDMGELSRLDFLILVQGIAEKAGLELIRRTFHLSDGTDFSSYTVRPISPGSPEPTP